MKNKTYEDFKDVLKNGEVVDVRTQKFLSNMFIAVLQDISFEKMDIHFDGHYVGINFEKIIQFMGLDFKIAGTISMPSANRRYVETSVRLSTAKEDNYICSTRGFSEIKLSEHMSVPELMFQLKQKCVLRPLQEASKVMLDRVTSDCSKLEWNQRNGKSNQS